jgi:hypothetical protein
MRFSLKDADVLSPTDSWRCWSLSADLAVNFWLERTESSSSAHLLHYLLLSKQLDLALVAY